MTDSVVGLFDQGNVTIFPERTSREIAAAAERFFNDATRDDVLLFYYSGHGLTNERGDVLLLCGRDSQSELRMSTTVSSDLINRMSMRCPAAAVVIVLDCCHAGAFKGGEFGDELAGKGRFVLAAGRAIDRAADARHATDLSRFTSFLLRGIRGEAAQPASTHVTRAHVQHRSGSLPTRRTRSALPGSEGVRPRS